MAFKYNWKDGEANFGPPISNPVPGGSHITFEIIPRFEGKLIAVRRPTGIPDHELPSHAVEHPEGFLYFCHGLIRRGEAIEGFLTRAVHEQLGVGVRNYKILNIESELQEKDGQWAFMPYALVELSSLPFPSSEITEVVAFTRDAIPSGFGWWTKEELEEFLAEHSLG